MLKLAVIDASAESRTRVVRQIQDYLSSNLPDIALLPRINVIALSLEEVKFHAAPDICVVGDEIAARELSEIANIRKLLNDTPILVRLNPRLENLVTIENLARMGADDTFSESTTANDFFRKIILLARKRAKSKPGQLILIDSGKGGMGVTTLAAGLAESLSEQNKKVCLIDLDFETQDLSRFLQAKPFVNENLQLLFEAKRPITEEFVRQCLVPVWDEADGLFCMAPSMECEELYDARSPYSRSMISILEVLDSIFDCVVVDVGSVRGAMLRSLYRVADKIVFVLNNNPASLYASVDKIQRIKRMMAPNGELVVVNNSSTKAGLPHELLKKEFNFATKLNDSDWFSAELTHCKAGSRWPGSGNTLFSCGSGALMAALKSLLYRLKLVEAPVMERVASASIFERIRGNFTIKLPKVASKEIRLVKNEKSRELAAVKPTLSLPAGSESHLELVSAASLVEDVQTKVAVNGFKTDGLAMEELVSKANLS